MLMSLAVGSIHIQGQTDQEFQDQAIELEQQVAQDEQVKQEVVQQLEQVAPEILDEIALDEAELNAHFSTIKKLVDKKNKEIEKLSAQAEVNEAQIAKIGIELADAQIALKKAEAAHRAKHKKAHKFEQAINDALKKAEQGLKYLNDSATGKAVKSAAVEGGRFISEKSQQAYKATKKGISQGAEFVSEQGQNYITNKKARIQKATQARKELARGNFSKAGTLTQEGIKEDFTQNPFRTPKKKSKASKAVRKASAQQPMLMDEDIMIDQAMDDAMLHDEVIVQSTSDTSTPDTSKKEKRSHHKKLSHRAKKKQQS